MMFNTKKNKKQKKRKILRFNGSQRYNFTPQIVFELLKKIFLLDTTCKIKRIDKTYKDAWPLRDFLKETKNHDNHKSINICKLLKEIYSYSFGQTDDLSFNNLGFMYRHGLGVIKNVSKGLTLLKIAADLNNVYAMRNLGAIYDNKYNMYKNPNDFTMAVKLYTKASELGLIYCMNDLGFLYRNLDHKESENWYKKGVEKGAHMAKSNLALLYYRTNEYEKAIVLYKELKLLKENKEFDELDDSLYDHDYTDLINKCMLKLRKLSTLYNNIQEDNCTCCLDPLMNTNKSVLTLVCGHSFHYVCTKSCKSCPICRNVIE